MYYAICQQARQLHNKYANFPLQEKRAFLGAIMPAVGQMLGYFLPQITSRVAGRAIPALANKAMASAAARGIQSGALTKALQGVATGGKWLGNTIDNVMNTQVGNMGWWIMGAPMAGQFITSAFDKVLGNTPEEDSMAMNLPMQGAGYGGGYGGVPYDRLYM